jgi:L-alanine-DL-glutamate epimerase-like enolase superfamily enzyme
MHVASATSNLFKVENVLGAFRGHKEDMALGVKPELHNGKFLVPEGPGLGLEINEDWLKAHMEKGETWWG